MVHVAPQPAVGARGSMGDRELPPVTVHARVVGGVGNGSTETTRSLEQTKVLHGGRGASNGSLATDRRKKRNVAS
jgi:hypothetical protein